ncbi:TPA: 2OG-Fe dioxygenase family protein [Serratia marcescens]|uniref:2OG-Fe dioxygenase family protein n=1 Tax=Serratia marcescens TaxID=615 RepID=UPI002FF42C51
MRQLSLLDEVKKAYQEHRSAFIPGATMQAILLALGARPEDFARLQQVSANLADDPTLPFRKSRNGRFCFDFDRAQIERLEFQPFVLSVEEDFIRYDSGKVRHFRGINDDLQLNTAFQALMKFKAYVIDGVSVTPRPRLNQEINKFVCTVFNLRTVTTPQMLGEPALEGVHSDGVDHTMTTFLGCDNMTDDSAKTFIHDMRETSGIKFDRARTEWILGEIQHRHFLDTLLIVDHERKHSLSPVEAQDKRRHSTRDMLIFFTRKPVEDGHVSFAYDSFKPHIEIPLSIDMVARAS